MARLFVIFVLGCVMSLPSWGRQSCDWPFRTAVNIQENSGATLTDYQVKLTLSGGQLSSQYNWSIDGFDLRVFDSDDNTALSFWIESWDSFSQTAEVWVRFPTLTANSNRTIYLYYGNQNASTLATVPFTFIEPGIKFHTRNVSSDPNSYNQAINAFEASNDNTNGYGCKFIENFTNINNSSEFGSGNNFIAYSETFFEVQAGENGVWSFRYGADFGNGGGLYVNNNPLDEKWFDDLWWSNNWNNTNETLSGSVNLPSGYHKLEVIGAEECCDGGITVQFRKPGGNWQTFSTTNIDIRSRACPVEEPSINFGAHDICGADLELLTSSASNQTWAQGSNNTLSFTVRNNDSATDAAPAPTQLSINIPAAFSVNTVNGTGWSCSGSNPLICNYAQDLNSSQAVSNSLNVSLTANTAVSNANITAEVNGVLVDSNTSNNTQDFFISVLAGTGLPANCSNPQPGLLASFYDVSDYSSNAINNAGQFQSLVDNFANMQNLMGQTIIADINKASSNNGNLFDAGSNDEWLLVIQGFIYMDNSRSRRFAIDGDDAVEARINGAVATAWYGNHGANNAPRNGGNNTTLNQGFNSIEFRLHENQGNDAYALYWRPPGNFTIIPSSVYYHCAGDANIQLNSEITVLNDPINNTSQPKAIPGAELRYSIRVENLGNISTDLGSTQLTQEIDTQNKLFVNGLNGATPSTSPIIFTDGSGLQASSLSFNFNGLSSTNDSIAFSNNGGASFNYTPSADSDGYDENITHFRLNLPGTFKPSKDGTTPNFTIEYQVMVK
ncbi:CCXG family PEP-CTERM protein [Bermanella sp. R86510]|uniref:CCXG family PEP-CTERM protein n=1 Tax=unclassified Bermanella TaxID=2627862 RepID=UPI0037C7F5F8